MDDDVEDFSKDTKWILVSKLLPCSTIDGGVTKFSGNRFVAIQNPDKRTDMQLTIDAFVHFTFIWTHGFLLLCDLQGESPAHVVSSFM